MNVGNRRALVVGVLAGLVSGFGVLGLKHVFADGIPNPTPLYYSGTLSENGQLVTGARSITVTLWPDATTQDTPLCYAMNSAVNVVGGRFRMPLPDSCKTGINQFNNAQIQVTVGATTFARTPVGAVPYAIEADHATSATNAVDGGGIATAIDQIRSLTHSPSGIAVHLETEQSIPNVATPVLFDYTDFDLAGEYVADAGAFVPRENGTYFIDCTVEFSWAVNPVTGEAAVQVFRNGSEIMSNEVPNLGVVSRPLVAGVANLSANDEVTCDAYQSAYDTMPLTIPPTNTGEAPRNSFGVARLY